MPELADTRIAILEVETEYLKSSLNAHSLSLNHIEEKIDSIKERIDKQNGTLPHMVEGLKGVSDSVKKLDEKLNVLTLGAVETRIKAVTMWGIMLVVVSAIIGIGVKIIFGV